MHSPGTPEIPEILELKSLLYSRLDYCDSWDDYYGDFFANLNHDSMDSAYGQDKEKLTEAISFIRSSKEVENHDRALEWLNSCSTSSIATLFKMAIPLYFSKRYAEMEVMSALKKLRAVYKSSDGELSSDSELRCQTLRILIDLYQRGNQYISENVILCLKYYIEYYHFHINSNNLNRLKSDIEKMEIDPKQKEALIKRCQIQIYMKDKNELALGLMMKSLDLQDPEEYKSYKRSYFYLYVKESMYLENALIFSHSQIIETSESKNVAPKSKNVDPVPVPRQRPKSW